MIQRQQKTKRSTYNFTSLHIRTSLLQLAEDNTSSMDLDTYFDNKNFALAGPGGEGGALSTHCSPLDQISLILCSCWQKCCQVIGWHVPSVKPGFATALLIKNMATKLKSPAVLILLFIVYCCCAAEALKIRSLWIVRR